MKQKVSLSNSTPKDELGRLTIAKAVGNQAIQEGSATVDEGQLQQELTTNILEAVDETYERVWPVALLRN
jgi:hypothetical protein